MIEMKTLTIGDQTYKVVDGDAVRSFYSTTREALGVAPESVNSSYIWGLYDALMVKHPDRVQKNEIRNNDGTFTNYEYVISTGEYNTEGAYIGYYGDKDIKKPKYLILSGIHGYEEPAILSAYRFIRDVLEGHNVPSQFIEGCVIRIMPVGNPYSLDNHIRYNENGVDINRNFDWNWGEKVTEGKNPGPSAASENETQAIVNWLVANQDAEMFFDCHNQGAVLNEIAWFVGLDNNRAKQIALQGVGRVVPFWRDVIGYAEGTVYPISVTLEDSGLAIDYASEVLNIPSLAFEMSALQNDRRAGINANDVITPETVSAGAEVIGNVLIEFYEQMLSGEVVDMTETNEKLDALAEIVNGLSKGFRIETGTLVVQEDTGSCTTPATIAIPCPSGAKIVTLLPDDATRIAIADTTAEYDTNDTLKYKWLLGFVGQVVKKLPWGHKKNSAYDSYRGVLTQMTDFDMKGKYWTPGDHASTCNGNEPVIDNGFSFVCLGIKAGTYNWTAYYWNE